MFDNYGATMFTLAVIAPCILFPFARSFAVFWLLTTGWIFCVVFYCHVFLLAGVALIVFFFGAPVFLFGALASIIINRLRSNEQLRPVIPVLHVGVVGLGLLLYHWSNTWLVY